MTTKTTKEQESADYYAHRLAHAAGNGSEKCFPNDFKITVDVPNFRETWNSLKENETDESTLVQMSGRVINKREAGKKLIFLDVRGPYQEDPTTEHFQILLSKKTYEVEEEPVCTALSWSDIKTTINRGDIVGVVGYPHRTMRGELSVQARGIRVLAPCLHDIPREFQDRQLVDSQRYLHYIVNPKAVMPILMRSKFVSTIRRFLDDNGFLEVETPILETGTGANAEPFMTHYRSINADVNLRVAPELKLKMAVIAGFGPVYEIGKQFRNEGMDPTHNPEFTTCEFYWPYKTIDDLFHVTEQLFHRLSMVAGTHLDTSIAWSESFTRVDIVPELERILDVTFVPPFEGEKFHQYLIDLVQEKGFDIPNPPTIAKLFDTLISELIESKCTDPTFIYGHPLIMSPLAKPEIERPHIAARFELFVRGQELCNAYSELNNPVIQRKNFIDQQKAQDAGDRETIKADGYCLAMEYGLPPTAGWGMGIDRALMSMLNISRIGDTVMFPLSRASRCQ